MKLNILLLLSLLIFSIKTQDTSESSEGSSSEDQYSDEQVQGKVKIADIANGIINNLTSDESTAERNALEQKSASVVLAALQKLANEKKAKGEEAVIVTESGDKVPIEEAASFSDDCAWKKGSALKKVEHDGTYGVDKWNKWTDENGHNQSCITMHTVLCQSMWKISRPPYFAFFPAEEYAWGERVVIASPEKLFGCHITMPEIGHILCQYWFGAGWMWHNNGSGRWFIDMYGTNYSYANWPFDDNTPGKYQQVDNYRTLSNINAQPNESFWVESVNERTCY